jgi:hypothetical protein
MEGGGGLPRRGGWGGCRGRLAFMLWMNAGTEGKAGRTSEHIRGHVIHGTHTRRGNES